MCSIARVQQRDDHTLISELALWLFAAYYELESAGSP